MSRARRSDLAWYAHCLSHLVLLAVSGPEERFWSGNEAAYGYGHALNVLMGLVP